LPAEPAATLTCVFAEIARQSLVDHGREELLREIVLAETIAIVRERPRVEDLVARLQVTIVSIEHEKYKRRVWLNGVASRVYMPWAANRTSGSGSIAIASTQWTQAAMTRCGHG
jgi:hypothetical protein